MEKINHEIKTKLFAQYLGQQCFCKDLNRNTEVDIDLLYNYNLDDCKLILKPLSEVSNEDAIECLKLKHEFLRGDEFTKVVVESRTKEGFTFICSYKNWADNREGIVLFGANNPLSVYQYLISKGYDMPQLLLNGNTAKELGLAIYE